MTCNIELTATLVNSTSGPLARYLNAFQPRDTVARILAGILAVPTEDAAVLATRTGQSPTVAVFAISITLPASRDRQQAADAAAAAVAAPGAAGLAAQLSSRLPLYAAGCRLRSPPAFFGLDGLPLGLPPADAPSAGFIAAAVVPPLVTVAAVVVWLTLCSGLELASVWYRQATEKVDPSVWDKIQAVSQHARTRAPPHAGTRAHNHTREHVCART
jgi:hypothetical protein